MLYDPPPTVVIVLGVVDRPIPFTRFGVCMMRLDALKACTPGIARPMIGSTRHLYTDKLMGNSIYPCVAAISAK
jgi:hypothetical protein